MDHPDKTLTDHPDPTAPLSETCPHCGSKIYGDNSEDEVWEGEPPVYYECGSGYMTADNDPYMYCQTTGCAIIVDLKAKLTAAEKEIARLKA